MRHTTDDMLDLAPIAADVAPVRWPQADPDDEFAIDLAPIPADESDLR